MLAIIVRADAVSRPNRRQQPLEEREDDIVPDEPVLSAPSGDSTFGSASSSDDDDDSDLSENTSDSEYTFTERVTRVSTNVRGEHDFFL